VVLVVELQQLGCRQLQTQPAERSALGLRPGLGIELGLGLVLGLGLGLGLGILGLGLRMGGVPGGRRCFRFTPSGQLFW